MIAQNTKNEKQVDQQPKTTESILKQANMEQQFTFANRYEYQPNCIFIDYHNEILIPKLKDFLNLVSYQRIAYVRNIINIRQYLKNNNIDIYYDLITKIGKDTPEIKLIFLEQLPLIIQQILKENNQNQLKNIVLKVAIEYLKNQDLFLKQKTAQILTTYFLNFKPNDREKIINESYILLNHQIEQNKIVGVKLFCTLIKYIPKDLIDQSINNQILVLGEGTSSVLKRQTIISLKQAIQYASKQCFQNEIIPFYFDRLKQNTQKIKKACLEVIYQINKKSELRQDKELLAQFLLKYLKDTNKLVKAQAYKILPYFLSACKIFNGQQNQNTLKLIDIYFKILESDAYLFQCWKQILKNVSYTFYAVLTAVGRQRQKLFFKFYCKLLDLEQKEVKIPLVSCYMEFIVFVSNNTSIERQNLIKCYDIMLKDKDSQIRYFAVQQMSAIINYCNKTIKLQFLEKIMKLHIDYGYWRIRYSLALQIQQLVNLYSNKNVMQYILPMSLHLCQDYVYQIRKQVSKHIWIFISIVRQQKIQLKNVINSILGLGKSQNYLTRISFISICQTLQQFEQIFLSQFVDLLQILVNDRILSVRIKLAELVISISTILFNQENIKIKNDEKIKKIQSILRQKQQQEIVQVLSQN